jgi:hypothetical protein
LIHLVTINKNWEKELIPTKIENAQVEKNNEKNYLYNRCDKATQIALLSMTLLLKICKQFKNERLHIQKI